MKRSYIIYGIIIILLIAGALFAWERKVKEPVLVTPTIVQPTPLTPVEPAIPPAATSTKPEPAYQKPAGWKTYESPLGYKISYPSEKVQFEVGKGYISIIIPNSSRGIYFFSGSGSLASTGPFKDTMVGPYKALLLFEKGSETLYIYSPNKLSNTWIGIMIDATNANKNMIEQDYELLNRILLTFVFIEPHEFYTTRDEVRKEEIKRELLKEEEKKRLSNNRAIHIEGWNTYRNEKFGFEVQFPSNWFVYDKERWNKENCGATDMPYMIISKKNPGKCWSGIYNDASPKLLSFNVYERGWYFPFIYEGPATHTTVVDGILAKKEFFAEYLPRPRGQEVKIEDLFYRNKEYSISFPQDNLKGAYDPIFDKILSTFKFID